ncbi:hypothetical protein D3876_06715 [Sphingomonas cavernae]|uniref:Uncharacterized protein n=1 Tax=Sphingomonas cavernae TaxID=2320861 RepID=A0A418WRX0_9SPHN|nr:hypothetical protein D3876_06715 [Sphingomonas cavernae]
MGSEATNAGRCSGPDATARPGRGDAALAAFGAQRARILLHERLELLVAAILLLGVGDAGIGLAFRWPAR